jgi:hypothetical protein
MSAYTINSNTKKLEGKKRKTFLLIFHRLPVAVAIQITASNWSVGKR